MRSDSHATALSRGPSAPSTTRNSSLIGAVVSTPYGEGTVLTATRSDNIVQIKLAWGAVGFFVVDSKIVKLRKRRPSQIKKEGTVGQRQIRHRKSAAAASAPRTERKRRPNSCIKTSTSQIVSTTKRGEHLRTLLKVHMKNMNKTQHNLGEYLSPIMNIDVTQKLVSLWFTYRMFDPYYSIITHLFIGWLASYGITDPVIDSWKVELESHLDSIGALNFRIPGDLPLDMSAQDEEDADRLEQEASNNSDDCDDDDNDEDDDEDDDEGDEEVAGGEIAGVDEPKVQRHWTEEMEIEEKESESRSGDEADADDSDGDAQDGIIESEVYNQDAGMQQQAIQETGTASKALRTLNTGSRSSVKTKTDYDNPPMKFTHKLLQSSGVPKSDLSAAENVMQISNDDAIPEIKYEKAGINMHESRKSLVPEHIIVLQNYVIQEIKRRGVAQEVVALESKISNISMGQNHISRFLNRYDATPEVQCF